MLKKVTLLAMSVGALLALAAPAAQAEGPLITNDIGEKPTYIRATSGVITTQSTFGITECTTTVLTIHLTENANTTVKGHGTGSMTGEPSAPEYAGRHTGHCFHSYDLKTEVTSVVLSDFHLTKHGAETTGTATFTLTYDLRQTNGAPFAECTWGGTFPVKKSGTDSVYITGELKKTTGSVFCPTAGIIAGEFTLEEDWEFFTKPIHIP